jgi:bacillithiol biosynthesis deacetylase BshB1
LDISPVDLLVFGPHPDDIEIGFGGAVALHAARGFRVGLCDLTRGELGSNGTVEERLSEAEAARAVLGAEWRINLAWPDGGPYDTPEHLAHAAALTRAARPRVVAVPYWEDRHPDHRAASDVLSRALFQSGLRRLSIPAPPGFTGALEAWRPERVCYYFINDAATVSFGLDVSEVYDKSGRRSTATAPSSPLRTPTACRQG